MRLFRAVNLLALLLCLVVVVLGAYVRLSDAGLGCPDWPGCYGQLTVPEGESARAQAARQYPARPLEAHKAWKEMIHRYAASTLGLLIVALALLSRNRADPRMPVRLPWVLVVLVVFQGLLGMWTVTWQLKPLAVVAHLIGGMTTLALLLWLRLATPATPQDAPATPPVRERQARSERQAWFDIARDAPPAPVAPRGSAPLRLGAGLALLLLAGQIFLGGWTSSNYAALACPDLPACHGRWLPDLDLREAFTLWRGLGRNYEHGVLDARARITIHWMHRVGALLVALVVGLLGIVLWRRGATPLWRRLGVLLLAALALQLGLGLTIVALQLPLALAAAHNAGAAVLLLALVSLNFHAWQSPGA